MTIPPTVLKTRASWKGPDMLQQSEQWILELTAEQVQALEQAARAFIQSGTSLENISLDSFPCEALAPRLKEIKNQLVNGRGFQLIRGLDIAQYTRAEVATMFMGVGAHIGQARSQNAAGHLLGHVRNIGADGNDNSVRIYQTNERQTFHTDSCDVVALICLQTSKQGGESLLVSAESIYNEMQRRDPALLKLLFEPIATDKRGEIEPGQKPYFTIPVFSWHADKLSVIYQRQYIDSAQRFEDAPRLTKAHVQALDLFDELANDPNLNFSMQLQTGDMQFVHNHSMLHDRGSFIDWPELEKRRHLLRLWLTVDSDRPLPDVFKQRFGTTEIGNRGGVIVAGTQLQVPLD